MQGYDVEPLDFSSLKPIEIPVKYAGTEYVLHEVDSEGHVQFRNAEQNATVYDANTGLRSGYRNLAAIEPLLVSLCLKCKSDDKRVSVETIRSWPERVVGKLFERAKQISDIDKVPMHRWQLFKLLELEECPVDKKVLIEFIDKQDAKDYKDLQEWFKPLAEELAKNEQLAMTNTSG